MDEHRWGLLQEEERSLSNPLTNPGPALKPLLTVGLVLASVIAAPALAEESRTLEEKLLHCEEVVEQVDDFNDWSQNFAACMASTY